MSLQPPFIKFPPACPVCEGELFDLKFYSVDFFLTGDVFPVVECRQCQMLLTANLPEPQDLSRYYESEDYISHSNIQKGLVNRVYHVARTLMLRRKYRLIKKKTAIRGGRILDIGAGTGHFLNYMKERGWLVNGIEPGSAARNFALEAWKISLLDSDQLFHLPEKSFDAITLWHVLEHLPDPNSYLAAAAKLLKPHGKLIIALPNPGSRDALYYGTEWAAWDLPRHVAHYYPHHLKQLAERHSFKVDSMHAMPLDPFYIAQLSEKYRRSNWQLLRGAIVGAMGWMAGVRNCEKASSILYVCSAKNDSE